MRFSAFTLHRSPSLPFDEEALQRANDQGRDRDDVSLRRVLLPHRNRVSYKHLANGGIVQLVARAWKQQSMGTRNDNLWASAGSSNLWSLTGDEVG